ncbi:hypothetical protein [Streptomyces pseudogriseolus]|uniref:hypothetical protein n=1 Tax=Streptomyces pseudogriseolus TaxID=36817 RepID=UPI00131A1FD7|nr:hypothetical protein [Streptomyces gancidicus]
MDIDVTDTGGEDCPDSWQIGARLSPVSGEATLTATADLAASPSTYVPTGLTVTLPEPGRYQLHWNVLGQICGSNPVNGGSNRWIQARVVNATTGSPLGPVRTVIQHQYAASIAIQSCVDATAPIDHQVTVTAAPLTLRLEAVLFGPGGTVTSAVIHGGQTAVTWAKIAD